MASFLEQHHAALLLLLENSAEPDSAALLAQVEDYMKRHAPDELLFSDELDKLLQPGHTRQRQDNRHTARA